MNLIELLEKYTKLQRDIFYEQMADYMDHAKVRKMEEEAKDLETEIVDMSKSADAYNKFTEAIEELDNDIFNILISNLDSNPDRYITLHDLFGEYNNIHKCKVVIPVSALVNLKIKY